MIDAESMNRAFQSFRKHFNAQEFYEAHEVMESLWAAGGYETKSPYRALTQLAVALAHIKTGNVSGARSVFAKARTILVEPWDGPTDTAQLLRDTYECIEADAGTRHWPVFDFQIPP